jgi:hypothetical protein
MSASNIATKSFSIFAKTNCFTDTKTNGRPAY